MRLRQIVLSSAALAVLTAFAGCASGGPVPTHKVRTDIGGYVTYAFDATRVLSGATVTLTDIDGDERTATTDSAGLWTIEDLMPGTYLETYSLTGYESLVRPFILAAGGEQDIKNSYVGRGNVGLSEVPLQATVSLWNALLVDGDQLRDGFGVTATYTTGQDIVVTTSRRVIYGSVTLDDLLTGTPLVTATVNTADTIFTISRTAIAGMNGGTGPSGDSNPNIWNLRLRVDVNSYSPIHGTDENTDARIDANSPP